MKEKNDFYQVSLKLLLKNEKGEVLVLGSPHERSFKGMYDIPGGRIMLKEFNTPIEEILRREVREEIGDVEYELNLKLVAYGRHAIPGEMYGQKEDVHVLYLFFEGIYMSGEVVISKEHIHFKWIDFCQNDPAEFLKSGNLDGMEMYLKNVISNSRE